ncbi:Putative ketoacyl reductase [Roseovarius litorisediminis]|uniref:Putative ketoacyl reductase n=1 Tax=Roseovarius litorisediminis TaxID=1312363 RepID=A0A1Y5TKC9_9RHOB|nr:SDR family NAD(P)-dependent oxidoreductase [Roseovarius litorisediminis]SLN65654.1 Putative ketoacyl reductase [Roseovarius litorisediminis]
MTARFKIALITGAGSGIGREMARHAAKLGLDLILVGRTEASLIETREMVPEARVSLVVADVCTVEGRATIVAAAGDTLDYLVNNAGTLKVGHLADLDDDALARMVNTNLLAPIALTRDLIPALEAAHGRIVNIGSVFGDIAYPFFAAYSATKFGLRGFSDALRRELSGRGIGVTYIAPRATRTAAQSEFSALVEPLDMALDCAEEVARDAWAAILDGRRESFPKGKERFFVKVQRLFPSLVDKSVGAQARAPQTLAALKSVSEM